MNKPSKRKTLFIRILTMIGFISFMIVPVRTWVVAQSEMRYFSSAHSIYTSEFGIESPQGMIYSSDTDAFVVWGSNNIENEIFLRNESSRKINLPQNVENSLGAAFDPYSKSMFIIDSGNAELVTSKIEGGNRTAARFNIKSLGLQDIQGITFDPATGRLFILDATTRQLLAVSPHPVDGFNQVNAANNKIRHVDLRSLSPSVLRGIAFNPNNGHLYIGSPDERKVYELKETGEKVSVYDISGLHFENQSTMLFAPSQDTTDDPKIMALYILDGGQPIKADSSLVADERNSSQKGQIVELSLQTPAALPPGTTLLPSTLVRVIDTSNAAWNPSSPDPSGVDYWPLSARLLIVDSEVDEMPSYWQGKNVFQSTTSGSLTNTCSTSSFTNEPTGVAINPNNNHIFISTDFNDRIFEVTRGSDGTYCTSDDTVTSTDVSSLYNVNDAEDVAYGNNTLFIAGGTSAEVYAVPLGANGVLGGGDDGAMTHFDTASLGFSDLEGIGYNSDNGTLFIVSTAGSDRYLGETTRTGTLLRAYDLSLMGSAPNIRSDVTFAPSSQNPAIKNIYIASRGIDNDVNRNENDGRVWEIRISNPTPTPTPTLGPGASHAKVYIGGALINEYNIPPKGSIRTSYAGVDDGPVRVASTNGVPIVAALRDLWSGGGNPSSSIQLMGLPENQLSDTYWFPAYNNVSLDDQLRFGNVGTAPTIVTVTIGGIQRGTYPLNPNESVRVNYPNLDSGPVKVQSSGGVKIIASIRDSWHDGTKWSSYAQLMGLPNHQLSDTYLFPAYNNVSVDEQLRFGNVGSAPTTVTVTIGGIFRGSYVLQPNQSHRVSYDGVDSGPVKVQSTGGVKIIASIRDSWNDGHRWTSYFQLMGLPFSQLSDTYLFPAYDNVSLDGQLRFGNVGTAPTQVTVTIGGVVRGTYTLQPNESRRVNYGGLDSGPVKIQSSGGVKIIASLRDSWFDGARWTSYSQLMGLPGGQLYTVYLFPAYNNVSLDDQLRIGVP